MPSLTSHHRTHTARGAGRGYGGLGRAASCSSSSKPVSRLSELGTSLLERTSALKCRVGPLFQWPPCYANKRVFSARL